MFEITDEILKLYYHVAVAFILEVIDNTHVNSHEIIMKYI